tara:strand:+ start:888 stop:1211 length:324 start_codon:yes stop_codon:yes gene_type:complete
MAHFAEIDNNNIVTRVLVFNDTYTDSDCSALLGGNWIQTSYNNNIRKNFAGIGYTYDSNLDAFIAPKPFNSWVLDTDTCKWEAPIEQPEGDYTWNEDKLSWDKIEIG